MPHLVDGVTEESGGATEWGERTRNFSAAAAVGGQGMNTWMPFQLVYFPLNFPLCP
jgi:hypothetical protein